MKIKERISLLLAVIALFACDALMAQSKSEKLYDAFRNKPGVTYFAFNKSMTDAFNIDLDEVGKTVEGDLNEIRFMSYNPEKGQLSGAEFLKKSVDLLPSVYRQVESDDDENALVFVLGDKKKAREFHILVGGEKPDNMCFWISFYGDFDLKDLDGVKSIGREMAHDN